MAELVPFIVKLQADAADSSKSVSDLVRLAKIAATKLGTTDALVWIDGELDGYPSVLARNLPAYRQLYGRPKAWNPVRGWQSIMFANPETEKQCSWCPIGQSLTSLEASLRKADSSGHFTYDYPPQLAAEVQKAMNWHTDVHVEIGFGQLHNIIDQARNLVLKWSLALEKGGVLGEAMTFTAKEKTEAAPITHHYFIQNVGVLGNVTEHAAVHNIQTASISLDLKKVREFLAALRGSSGGLPADIRDAVMAEAAKADAAVSSAAPDQGVLRAALGAIGSVCEGAAANLTAMGIVAAIQMLMPC
jgi:hypothetical protein